MKRKTSKSRASGRGLSAGKQPPWKQAAGGKARPAKAAGAGPAHRIPDRVVNNLYEAKLNLSRLVDRAAAGEEIVIAKNGRPMAKLVPMPPQPKRVPGGWEGKVWEAPDCWAPMTEEELKLWYEGDGESSP